MENKEKIVLDENKYTAVENKIKKPFYKKGWFKFLIGFILVVFIVNLFDKDYIEDNYVNINWSDLELSSIVPEPDCEYKASIEKNSKDELIIGLYKFDEIEYNNYLDKVKKSGFDIDINSEVEWFEGYNNEDYKIKISLNTNVMEIEVSKLKALSEIVWPEVGPAIKLPEFKTNIGYIEKDSSSSFVAILGEVDDQMYNEYTEECKKIGFNQNFYKDEKHFEGKNEKGDSLLIVREPVNRLKIEINLMNSDEVLISQNVKNKIEENVKVNNTEKNKPQIKNNKVDNTVPDKKEESIRPEVKEKFDKYEKFVNEYVSFVDKLVETEGKDFNVVTQYMEYMNRFMQFTEEFKEIENMNLNQKEIDYYIKLEKELTEKVNKALEKIK